MNLSEQVYIEDDEVWYCNGQAFKAGDIVKVLRFTEDFDPNGMGIDVMWENAWQNEHNNGQVNMGEMIGHSYIIYDITELGAHLVRSDMKAPDYFGFPLNVLEVVG